MKLTTEERISSEIALRIEAILENGCSCKSSAASLTKRLTAGGIVTIHLQCDTCGRSLGGALPRKDFYFWQSYPNWDNTLADRYWEQKKRECDAALDSRLAAEAARKSDYAEWLSTSAAWQAIRFEVIKRANYTCEACLIFPAKEVHHVTYAYGRLPPAWELRAVCRKCHTRLHEGWHDAEE